jgi:two-component system chemotaxis sensor kinase CheA
LEDLLDLARKGELEITNDFSDLILQGVDVLSTIAMTAEEGIRNKKVIVKEVKDLSLFDHIKDYISKFGASGEEGETSSIQNEPVEVVQEEKADIDQEKPKKLEDQVQDIINATLDQDEEVDETPEPEKKPEPKVKTPAMPRKLNFMKIDIAKMDQLVDLIGELVIVENMLTRDNELIQGYDTELDETMVKLKRISKSLQDISLKLRMVPIRETFSRMQRIVRDYTSKSGKKLILDIEGESTEIDRNMVEEIYEPLVHLIRNACDHGIEPLEERIRKNKPQNGKVELKAYYRGRNIVIDIIDDGKGLNRDSIRKKAVENGLINENDVLKDSEIYKLIFQSGFSMAQQVTDVSGRGVGMEVVIRAINKLRGKIDILTEIDKGTIFRISLPLTLAIIDGMVIRIGNKKYIIPTEYIKRNFVAQKEDYSKVEGKGEMIMYQENLINLYRLDSVFDIKGGLIDPWDGIIIIMEGMLSDYCIMVDEIIGKQEIVIKNLGMYSDLSHGVAGAAILSDGKIGLIIDVFGLEAIFEKSDLLVEK